MIHVARSYASVLLYQFRCVGYQRAFHACLALNARASPRTLNQGSEKSNPVNVAPPLHTALLNSALNIIKSGQNTQSLRDVIGQPQPDFRQRHSLLSSQVSIAALLTTAALEGRYDVLMCLIDEYGLVADCDQRDADTPLECALRNGHAYAAKVLLERGARVSRFQRITCNSSRAHGENDSNSKEAISSSSGSAQTRQVSLPTVLHYASSLGDEQLIEMVLTRLGKELLGREMAAVDSEGNTPLHWAVNHARVAIAQKLLGTGMANVNAKNISGETPLHLAVFITRDRKDIESEELVALLLRHGATTDAQDAKGRTPLWHAAFLANYGAAWKLLQNGADPCLLDASGQAPADVDPSIMDMAEDAKRASAR